MKFPIFVISLLGCALSSFTVFAAVVEVNVDDPGQGEATYYGSSRTRSDEIHVIGTYQADSNHNIVGQSTVRLRYDNSLGPMEPITLVINTYESTNWNFVVDPGFEMKEVLIQGFETQFTSGLPVGVSVTQMDEIWRGALAWPGIDDETQRFVANVEDRLGSPIASFSGAYEANDFVVTGSPLGQHDLAPKTMAGNISPSDAPDLFYEPATGNVTVRLTEDLLAAPNGLTGVALVNEDGRLRPEQRNPTPGFAVEDFGNEYRIGFYRLDLEADSLEFDLGDILPPGLTNQEFVEFFDLAHYGTFATAGEFDLIHVPEPTGLCYIMFALAGLITRRRRTI